MNKFNVKALSATALIAVLANVFSFAPVALAVVNDPEFDAALAWGYEMGLTSFNTQAAFMPMNTLTREQGARFLSQFGTEVLGIEADQSAACNFTDLMSADRTLQEYVIASCQQELLRGSNGMFMPKATMTKAQFVVALVRGLDGMMEESTTPWFKNYCEWAQESGITRETDCAALDKPITRYEAMLMLYRGAMDGSDIVDGGDDSDDSDDSDDTVTVEGEVAFTVSDVTPGVQYVPGNASNIQVLKFDVAAGESDVRVSSINFKLNGLVAREKVRVAITDENGVRLSTERTFNTNFEALVTANTANGMMIPANTVRSFYAIVSTSNSINERFTISIEGANSISANATVGGKFPISSNQINTVQYSAQTLNFIGQRPSVNSDLNSMNKLYVGETNKELGNFRLESAGSTNNRDAALKNIRLKSTKTLQGIVNNLRLEVNGQSVSTATIIDGKTVTFVLNDYVIPYGRSVRFFVRGDVIGGENTDYVEFQLEENSDVVALEVGTNAALSINKGSSTFLEAYRIEEGKNLISRVDTMGRTNVPVDADNILGLSANINATSAMSVDRIRVFATGTALNTSGNIEKVKLFINDLLVDEATTLTNGAYEFSFFGNLKAGANKVEVRFDTERNAANGRTIRFTLNSSSLIGAEYVATNNNVSPNDISGVANGAELIITAASTTISLTNPSANQIEIRESDNFTAIRFSIQASNVRDVVVRGFRFASNTGNVNGGLENASLMVAGLTGVQAIENFPRSTTSSVNFNSLNVRIPAGNSVEFMVYVKTNNSFVDPTVRFSASTFDIEDTQSNKITTINNVSSDTYTLTGNNITVLGQINVVGNRTFSEPTSIIPSSTTTAVRVGSFDLKADYGAARIEEITIVNVAGSFTGTNVTSGTARDMTSDGLLVTLRRGGQVVGNAQLLNGAAYIKLATPVEVPAGQSVVFDVEVSGAGSITSAGETNKTVRLGVLETNNLIDGTRQTLISSVGNSVNVTSTLTNVLFNRHTVRASTITLADQTAPTTNLIGYNGLRSIFRTRITAAGSRNANIYSVRFTHDSQGVTTSGFALRIDGSTVNLEPTDAMCTPSTASSTGSRDIVCVFQGTYANGLSIAAGASRDIELVAQVGVSSPNAYVTTSLQQRSSDLSVMAAANTLTGASIVWSDNASPTLTPATVNWFTDAGVRTLPTASWTFTDNRN